MPEPENSIVWVSTAAPSTVSVAGALSGEQAEVENLSLDNKACGLELARHIRSGRVIAGRSRSSGSPVLVGEALEGFEVLEDIVAIDALQELVDRVQISVGAGGRRRRSRRSAWQRRSLPGTPRRRRTLGRAYGNGNMTAVPLSLVAPHGRWRSIGLSRPPGDPRRIAIRRHASATNSGKGFDDRRTLDD